MLSKLAHLLPFRGNEILYGKPVRFDGIHTKVEQARRIGKLYGRAARFDVRDYHFPLQFETWNLPPYQLRYAIHQLSTNRLRSMQSLVS